MENDIPDTLDALHANEIMKATCGMNEKEALYEALRAPFGVIVRGSVKALRKARETLRADVAMMEMTILGPDGSGQIWLVRKDRLREHLITPTR